ncbi:hypothetical protein CEP52_017623 [Fusarium oligoseptatum]|uniref:Uncharacterized protein n=1 Tax=Fusarium oligoseptatum TaxID=2604345 RepID=A0A428RM01_9HYPO|nr:hypothetical protein CEP52_017623 [Fusarium oligoseptatum]
MFPSSHSGLQSQKDGFDRKLRTFYLNNWCPGRSVLAKTNPWPLILTQAWGNTAISDAIDSTTGCLAGIYIYDYLADERIREAVCRRYTMAAECYQELLNGLGSSGPGEGEESITLGVVLSTIHVVRVEEHHEKPGSPSWLEGYKQCKRFLHQTNPGGPFWENVAVQRSDLRDALSVIVGRGLIFSQLLAPLPDADLLNLPEQATEFNWLLFGNERETLEIDGGCGLSRQLLHSIGQVSYCVSCLMQKPESIVFQMTPKYLLRDLKTTRQWSRGHTSWEMAKATQAPLLPVFMLGLVAVDPEHKKVSQEWFEQVPEEPVRSSVPLLLQSLTRTWCWIDSDIKMPALPEVLPEAISVFIEGWRRREPTHD